MHRAGAARRAGSATALTNVFTGRPARGILNRLMVEVGTDGRSDAPDFPLAAGAVAPLRAKAEAAGSGDFSPLWSGQAGPLAREMAAGELTRMIAAEAAELLQDLATRSGVRQAAASSG